MTIGTVLDPTATVAQVRNPMGPPVGSVKGKVIGIRTDVYWVSWDQVANEWATMLEADGARVEFWRHSPPVGEDADEILASYDRFLARTDATIVGLCNCGSCTMWTIHDALLSLQRDRPTVVCSTEHFEALARTLALRGGRDVIRLQLLPFPLEGQDESYVRQVARDSYPHLLEVMGADAKHVAEVGA